MMRSAVVTGLILGASLAVGQQGNLNTPAPKPKQYVTYAAEEQVVKAGKKSVVELRCERWISCELPYAEV
jgi:hypothetical protein